MQGGKPQQASTPSSARQVAVLYTDRADEIDAHPTICRSLTDHTTRRATKGVDTEKLANIYHRIVGIPYSGRPVTRRPAVVTSGLNSPYRGTRLIADQYLPTVKPFQVAFYIDRTRLVV